jgi:hypothetical protein
MYLSAPLTYSPTGSGPNVRTETLLRKKRNRGNVLLWDLVKRGSFWTKSPHKAVVQSVKLGGHGIFTKSPAPTGSPPAQLSPRAPSTPRSRLVGHQEFPQVLRTNWSRPLHRAVTPPPDSWACQAPNGGVKHTNRAKVGLTLSDS